MKHGTRGGYSKGGCREVCCAAPNREYRRQLNRRPPRPPFEMTHGTVTGYKHHRCKCRPCTDAVVKYQRERKQEAAAALEARAAAPPSPTVEGAHCADLPTAMFFPVRTGHADYQTKVDAAVQVCDGCPAQLPCYAGAVARGEQHGIWGGVMFLATHQKTAWRPARRHDSEASYVAHLRAGETACDPCKTAHALYNQLRTEGNQNAS